MGIIIDLILIAIVLLSALLGYKKGLVKLAAKLFAGIIAIIITVIAYKPVANIVIKNTPIEEKIASTIVENTGNLVNKNEIANGIVENIAKEKANDIARSILYVLTAIVLFVIVKIIFSIIISLIDSVANLPLLKQFNEAGGMAYGIVRGLLIVGICILIMGAYNKVNPYSKLEENVENTYITKIIYNTIVRF